MFYGGCGSPVGCGCGAPVGFGYGGGFGGGFGGGGFAIILILFIILAIVFLPSFCNNRHCERPC